MRLAVQLIDTESANTVWSHRFTESAEEIAANPDDFPRIIASELAEQVMQAEMRLAMAKPGPHTGWEHVLRGLMEMGAIGQSYYSRPFEEFRAAVAVSPEYGLAHATLAGQLFSINTSLGLARDDDMRKEVSDHVARALQLDGNNTAVICPLVMASMVLGDAERAQESLDQGLAINPNFSQLLTQKAITEALLGREKAAIG